MEQQIPTSSRLFTLHYRQGAVMKQKNFPYTGNLKQAMDRAREHCKVMGIRFVLVNPLIVDLEYQEKIKKEKGFYEENEHGEVE
jgi:hypothetical protein